MKSETWHWRREPDHKLLRMVEWPLNMCRSARESGAGDIALSGHRCGYVRVEHRTLRP